MTYPATYPADYLAWLESLENRFGITAGHIWEGAQLGERKRSAILKKALDELLAAKRDSEQGAGWDHSRAQRVWREAAEAVRKYEASDAGSLINEK